MSTKEYLTIIGMWIAARVQRIPDACSWCGHEHGIIDDCVIDHGVPVFVHATQEASDDEPAYHHVGYAPDIVTAHRMVTRYKERGYTRVQVKSESPKQGRPRRRRRGKSLDRVDAYLWRDLQ